jgi:hypothetical protein
MAKAGDAVAAAAAAEEDCGGKRTKVWGDVQFSLFLFSVFQFELDGNGPKPFTS